MEVSDEDIKLAKEIIQTFIRAKKNLRMYPANNPIYAKTVEEAYKKLNDFYAAQDELRVRIKQNELLIGTDIIYQSSGKDENLALFFFKDGLRDIAFRKGITAEELQAFLEVLAFDFEREDIEDDVVTLLWEKDFQNIKYIVDETVLTEDEQYEQEAVKQAKGHAPEEDDLKKAYEDAFKTEDLQETTVIQITDTDLKALVKELERDSYDKKDRLIEILYDMLYHAESSDEYKEIVGILNSAIEFSIKHADLLGALNILKKAKELAGSSISDDLKRQINLIFSVAGSMEIVKIIAEFLDSDAGTDEAVFLEYVGLLNRSAIQPFMTVLGELKTINARKVVINALTSLGSKDITALIKGLTDERWYVVRNIIYILRRIGDKRIVEHLTKAVRHNDIRVRKEVIKALGELGGQGVVQPIKDCLDDPEPTVRTSAVRALGNINSEAAKRTILERISSNEFINKDFNEKKEYFEAISHWKDPEVFDFLMKTIKKKSFFKMAKNDENRACAAYGLGLLGNKDAISALYKLRDSKNKLLSEYAYSAVRRIEYGR